MLNTLDSLFGVHEKALIYRSKRAEVLASNIANGDTPGYKARDLDFHNVLKQLNNKARHLHQTHNKHIGFNNGVGSIELSFRNPKSASLDGNTVDMQQEQAQYAQNAMDYQTSLRFVNGKISSYLSALRGE